MGRRKGKKEESGMNSSIFRKIMVATDGSESVRKAVDSAIEIAKSSTVVPNLLSSETNFLQMKI